MADTSKNVVVSRRKWHHSSASLLRNRGIRILPATNLQRKSAEDRRLVIKCIEESRSPSGPNRQANFEKLFQWRHGCWSDIESEPTPKQSLRRKYNNRYGKQFLIGKWGVFSGLQFDVGATFSPIVPEERGSSHRFQWWQTKTKVTPQRTLWYHLNQTVPGYSG